MIKVPVGHKCLWYSLAVDGRCTAVGHAVTLQSVTAVPQRHGYERVQHCHDGQWHYVQHGEVDHVEGLRVVLDALHDTHCVCQAVGQLRGDSANPDETRGRVERAGHPHKHHYQLQHTHT